MLWILGLRPAFLPNLPLHSPDELRLALQLHFDGIANGNGTVVSCGDAALEGEEASTSNPSAKIHATRTWIFCRIRPAGRIVTACKPQREAGRKRTGLAASPPPALAGTPWKLNAAQLWCGTGTYD